MSLEHIKRQFEMVKDTETFVITTETAKWLIEQVGKCEKLQEDIQIKENHNQILRKSNREYLQTIETLEKQVDYWKVNYNIKESALENKNNVIAELNRYNEALIIENMSLKSTRHLRSLKNGGGFQEKKENNLGFNAFDKDLEEDHKRWKQEFLKGVFEKEG